jgi:hypothetical protein
MQYKLPPVKSRRKRSWSKPRANLQASTNVKSKRSVAQLERQSGVTKIEEVQAKQGHRGLVEVLYDFPQQSFLLLLFGVLAIGGSVAALCFKIDAPMFMQILYTVGAGCGIRIGADTVKHFKQNANANSNRATD